MKGTDEVCLPHLNSFHSIFIDYIKINFSKYHVSHWQDEYCEVRFISEKRKKEKNKNISVVSGLQEIKYVKVSKISLFQGHICWDDNIQGFLLLVSQKSHYFLISQTSHSSDI